MKISSKLYLFAILCSIIPLMAVFALSFDVVNESLTKTVKETLHARAVEELDTLQSRLADAKHELISLSMLSNMHNVREGGDVKSLQLDIDRFATRTPLFTEIIVANYSGMAVAGSIPRFVNTNLSGTWEFEAPKLGIHFDGPVIWSHRLNKNVATQSVPLYTDTVPNAISGALIGMIDWEILQTDLASSTLFGGQQDEKRMVFLESTSSQTVVEKILYGTKGIEPPMDLLSTPSDDGVVRQISLNDKNYMMVSIASRPYRDFRDPQWRIHILLDSDIAYAGITNLKNMYLISGAAILLLVVGISYLISRSIVNPVNSLVSSAEKLSAGDYDDELCANGAQDEIGQLTRSFDVMRLAIKKNEQELVQKTAVAEQAAKLKGEFLANMSHEVRTPINGVLGMTELLLNTPLEKKQIRYAETISRSGQALLAVINDILDFSKIEAGKLELTDGAFDLRLLTEDIIEMVVETAHRKGVEVILVIPPGSHVAYNGDANRLRQILLNLVGNAVKFTNEGEIKVRLSVEDSENDKSVVKFEVIDTGIGVPAAQQANIFDSFVQADGTATRQFGGTGLGLTISTKLAELMGGSIGMSSRPGSGSTFWFTASLKKLSTNVEKAWRTDDALEGKHVLVVDDNDTNREILEEQIKFWGASLVSVSSGAKALIEFEKATAANKLFDIAILDMQMPNMSGMDLVECINKHNLAKTTRLVLLSSSSEHDIAGCHEIGISSVAIKPVRQLDLYNSVTAVFTQTSSNKSVQKTVSAEIGKNSLKGHVLVVEDNPVNQDLMLEMLRQLGATAMLSNNGEDALKAIKKYKFDVVLMDCQMPVMDGFEATAAIRLQEEKSSQTARMPIVALTANAMEGDRERCLECGMDEYMSKPVSFQTIKETLSRWMATSLDMPTENNVSEIAISKSPILDQTIFNEVCSMCAQASPGFFDSLLAKYNETSVDDIKVLENAIRVKDSALVSATAHRLKSSSVNWGGKAMGDACQLLETAGKEDKLEGANELMEQVYTNHRDLVNEIHGRASKAA